VAPEHALDVEGCGAEAVGYGFDLRRGDEQEDGRWIDEAADQPGASDAVDLGAGAGHPDGPALRITSGNMIGSHQQAAALRPALEATVEGFGSSTSLPQPSSDALAQLEAALADHGHRLAGIGPGPGCDRAVVTLAAGGQRAGIGRNVIVYSDVENDGCLGSPYETRELGDGDCIGYGHGVPSCWLEFGRDTSA